MYFKLSERKTERNLQGMDLEQKEIISLFLMVFPYYKSLVKTNTHEVPFVD